MFYVELPVNKEKCSEAKSNIWMDFCNEDQTEQRILLKNGEYPDFCSNHSK